MTRGTPLISVLNGPNMNMLGLRQPHVYGAATLGDVEALCAETAEELGLAIEFRQTNYEGELVTWAQECRGRAAGIVINPAGCTTTSISLMDALLASELPVMEVHVTQHPRARRVPPALLRLESGGRRDLRAWDSRLCLRAACDGRPSGGKLMASLPFSDEAVAPSPTS
jgi:3-dehydroquinate dehydratase